MTRNLAAIAVASAVAAPLPIIEQGASVPNLVLYLHLPTVILVLVLFRLFIHAATRTGSFRRWYGVPLIAIYLAYAALQYLIP